MTDNEPTCELQDGEPNHIEVIISEYQPPRPTVCRMWDRVKHRRSDEFNEQFLADHPQCG